MTDAERIIAAAGELFEAHGFHATSMEDVGIALGHSRGTVYSHFESKEDLFFAVLEERTALIVAEMKSELARGDDDAEALAKIAVADDGWLTVFFEFWAHVLRQPDLRARFAQLHARTLEPLIAALDGRVDNPRDVAAAIYAEQVGLSLERLLS